MITKENGKALCTDLRRLIEWAAGTILIGVGAGKFRDEINLVIQQVLSLGYDRARLNEFETIEKMLASKRGRAEVGKYIARQRAEIAKRWDFEF